MGFCGESRLAQGVKVFVEGSCMEQLDHLTLQSLQKLHWLWMCGGLASRQGMEQEQSRGRSAGWREVAGFVADDWLASSQLVNKMQLRLGA